jgi:hypothetical protein
MPPLAFIKFFLIFSICICNSAYAQFTLHVASFENHQPLPYASIVNYTKHLLVFSNEEGNVSVNFQEGDSISISYVGYRTLTIEFTDIAKQEIFLNKWQNLLAPVQIVSK